MREGLSQISNLRQPLILKFHLSLILLQGSLSGSQTCDRNTERRAGHVVEPELVAEFHGCGVATVLAADTDVELRVVRAAFLASEVHQLANTGLVKLCEGIVLEDLGIVVSGL